MQDFLEDRLYKIKDFFSKHGKKALFFYVLTVTVFLGWTYFFRPVVVSGSSMLPTLNNDETVFIKRFLTPSDIKRGDIIVFYSPLNGKELLIKRVIAVGGDTVAISEGRVYINGKLLSEPYLNGVRSHETIPLLRVPQGCFYVLGDNRVVSSDSREFGFVRFEDIYGKLVFKGEASSFK